MRERVLASAFSLLALVMDRGCCCPSPSYHQLLLLHTYSDMYVNSFSGECSAYASVVPFNGPILVIMLHLSIGRDIASYQPKYETILIVASRLSFLRSSTTN